MQVRWLFKRADNLHQAKYVFVVSKDENAEIVELSNMNANVMPLLVDS